MEMNQLERLIQITDRLMGPGGCPWDIEQTLQSLRPCIVEEGHELIEAIDLNDQHHILEELGDFFFVAFFLCKVAEKENICKVDDILKELNDKLVRRHPHVFGETDIKTTEEVLSQWAEIKKNENNKAHRKSALDSIPKGLPSLARAQKAYKKMRDAKYPHALKRHDKPKFTSEDALGQYLLELAAQAHDDGLDAEHALRRSLAYLEQSFRIYEKSQAQQDQVSDEISQQ